MVPSPLALVLPHNLHYSFMSLVSPKLDKIPQECFKKDSNARPRLSSIQRASSVSKLGRLVSHGVVRVELVEFTRLIQVQI